MNHSPRLPLIFVRVSCCYFRRANKHRRAPVFPPVPRARLARTATPPFFSILPPPLPPPPFFRVHAPPPYFSSVRKTIIERPPPPFFNPHPPRRARGHHSLAPRAASFPFVPWKNSPPPPGKAILCPYSPLIVPLRLCVPFTPFFGMHPSKNHVSCLFWGGVRGRVSGRGPFGGPAPCPACPPSSSPIFRRYNYVFPPFPVLV